MTEDGNREANNCKLSLQGIALNRCGAADGCYTSVQRVLQRLLRAGPDGDTGNAPTTQTRATCLRHRIRLTAFLGSENSAANANR